MSEQKGDVMRSSAMSEVWKPKYDLRDAQVSQKIMDPPPSHLALQSYLQRSQQKYSDDIRVTVEVQGIYGIPEEWITKMDDPAEQAYSYEVKTLGCCLKGGKLMPKEDVEESKEDNTSAKDKKAPPPKGKKDAPPEEQEMTPEEAEAHKKLCEEREKQNSRLQDSWNAMNEEQKFYGTAENKTKEPYITFPSLPNEQEGEEPIKTNVQEISLTAPTLKDFEHQINDPDQRRLKINVEKLVPVAGEDASKGKAAAKGKGGAAEEAKPINGEAYLDLTPFMYPGATETLQRCFISTVFPAKDLGEDGAEGSQPPVEEEKKSQEEIQQIYEDRHCYLLIKVTMSEPINPTLSPGVLPQAADIAKNAVQNLPNRFPNVEDAVKDYQNAIYAVVSEISIEYTRMFQEEEESNTATKGPGATASIKSQGGAFGSKREQREARREKFLIEFNSSWKFPYVRQKLKKAIFRMAIEKYNKQVDHQGLQTKQQKEKFKAELYTFLQEQMKIFINLAIDKAIEDNSSQMHNDLVSSYKQSQDEIHKKLNRNYTETQEQKFKRLQEEYDLTRDSEHAEWYLQNTLINECEKSPTGTVQDPDMWFKYGQFCLKYNMKEKAELFNKKYVDQTVLDENLNLIMGAMNLQNGNYKAAHHFIFSILKKEWSHIKANLLMGFIYQFTNRPGLQRKHFAIAKVQRMRELNQLQPKNNAPINFRTQAIEYPVEIIDYKTVATKDQQMKPDDSDQIFFELIDLLADNNLFKAADIALEYIQDQHSNQYQLTKCRIRVMQERYQEATDALDELLAKHPDNIEAWIIKGNAHFLQGNLFDSEESYIKALRLKPDLKDPVLQERLGIVYAKRKAWKDARTVFVKSCKERVTTTSWIYLGLSLLRLGELGQAEDAITQANILDNTNPKVWGIMTVLCLTTGAQRLQQANLCFKEALKLGLRETEIMEEIGDLYHNLQEIDQALISYQWLSKIAPDYPEGLRKYATVLEDPHSRNQNNDMAIEIYKKALEKIDGDHNKRQIAQRMEMLYNKMGRHAEIAQIQQYLDQDRVSGQLSDDNDEDDDGSFC